MIIATIHATGVHQVDWTLAHRQGALEAAAMSAEKSEVWVSKKERNNRRKRGKGGQYVPLQEEGWIWWGWYEINLLATVA